MNLSRRCTCILLGVALALLPSLGAAAAPPLESYTAVSLDKNLPLPPLVVRYDPAKFSDISLIELGRLSTSQASAHAGFPLLLAVDYLQEALKRMTGRSLSLAGTDDPARGIILTTLSEAPAALKNNPD